MVARSAKPGRVKTCSALFSSPAVSISEPSSERVKGAGLQLSPQDVLLVHGQAAANHRQEQKYKVEHSRIAQIHLDKLFCFSI